MSSGKSSGPRSKPDTKDHPTFILEIDTWKIRSFAEVDQQVGLWDASLGCWKYVAISYAWGPWHDKRATTVWGKAGNDMTAGVPANGKYPTFDPKLVQQGFTWDFPITNTSGNPPVAFADPIKPQFTMSNIKDVFTKIRQSSNGTIQYAWWDWACNAQGKWDELPTKLIKPQAPVTLPSGIANLADFQAMEVDKMRVVYSYAANGVLWLHQSVWKAANDEPNKTSLQKVLDQIDRMRKTAPGGLTMATINQFTDNLVRLRDDQKSLLSVWSFQEGALFGHPKRNPLTAGFMPCRIADANGDSYPPPAAGAKVPTTGDLLGDVVNYVDLTVASISMALEYKYKGITLEANLPQLLTDCYNDEPSARFLLSRLYATGFVGYDYGNPLSLFESKSIRSLKNTWTSEADRTVRAIIGAVDVEMTADKLVSARKLKDNTMKTETSRLGHQPSDAEAKIIKEKGDKAEAVALQGSFLDSLLSTYQWRMLLQARGETPKPTTPPAPTWWDRFVQLDRLPFASLDRYSGEMRIGLVYQPKSVGAGVPQEVVPNLPKLSRAANGRLQVTPINNSYIATTPVGWTTAYFYKYIPIDTGKQVDGGAGTVAWQKITPASSATDIGSNLILFPFETARVKAKDPQNATQFTWVNPLRCFIFCNFSGGSSKSIGFVGVGEFIGLQGQQIPLKMGENWEIY